VEYIFFILLLFAVFIVVFLYQGLLRSRIKPIYKILPLSLFIIIPAWALLYPKDTSIKSDITSPIKKIVQQVLPSPTPSDQLEKIIKSEIDNADGTYAVAIKNLKTNESYYYSENRSFTSASLYKLWYMGEIFHQIDSGKYSMDTILSKSAEEINRIYDIDPEYAEITEGYVTYTVEQALEKMITISDNYAAHLLGLSVGISNVREFLATYDLSSSQISTSPPSTTARDILTYYDLLYNKKLISSHASTQMLEILKRQTLNDRIPKYLPEDTLVAHKTGELYAVKHDAGIVFSPSGDYIIVLMSETSSQTTAAEIEAKISEKVWEYFNK